MASIAQDLIDKATTITPAERRDLLNKALTHQQRYETREQYFTFVKVCLPYLISILTLLAGVALILSGHEKAGISLLTSAGLAGGGTVGIGRVLDARKAKNAKDIPTAE
jgi:hypothetical protein